MEFIFPEVVEHRPNYTDELVENPVVQPSPGEIIIQRSILAVEIEMAYRAAMVNRINSCATTPTTRKRYVRFRSQSVESDVRSPLNIPQFTNNTSSFSTDEMDVVQNVQQFARKSILKSSTNRNTSYRSYIPTTMRTQSMSTNDTTLLGLYYDELEFFANPYLPRTKRVDDIHSQVKSPPKVNLRRTKRVFDLNDYFHSVKDLPRTDHFCNINKGLRVPMNDFGGNSDTSSGNESFKSTSEGLVREGVDVEDDVMSVMSICSIGYGFKTARKIPNYCLSHYHTESQSVNADESASFRSVCYENSSGSLKSIWPSESDSESFDSRYCEERHNESLYSVYNFVIDSEDSNNCSNYEHNVFPSTSKVQKYNHSSIKDNKLKFDHEIIYHSAQEINGSSTSFHSTTVCNYGLRLTSVGDVRDIDSSSTSIYCEEKYNDSLKSLYHHVERDEDESLMSISSLETDSDSLRDFFFEEIDSPHLMDSTKEKVINSGDKGIPNFRTSLYSDGNDQPVLEIDMDSLASMGDVESDSVSSTYYMDCKNGSTNSIVSVNYPLECDNK